MEIMWVGMMVEKLVSLMEKRLVRKVMDGRLETNLAGMRGDRKDVKMGAQLEEYLAFWMEKWRAEKLAEWLGIDSA